MISKAKPRIKISFEAVLVVIILTVSFIVFYRAPITASLWIDEAISFWIISDTFSETISRALNYQGQSPLYFCLLWCFKEVFGSTEYLLRIPSIVFFILALYFCFYLIKELMSREIALLTLLLLLIQDRVLVAAFSARPYALALLFSLILFWALIKWLKTEKKLYQLIFIFASAAMIYAHYLFGVMLLVVAIIVWQLSGSNAEKSGSTRSSRSRFWQMALSFILIVVLVAPAFPQLYSLFMRHTSLSFAAKPTLFNLIQFVIPPYMLLYMVLVAVFSLIVFGRCWKRDNLPDAKAFKVLLWWVLLAPCLYFIHALFSSHSFFIERFILWCAPALAAILAYLISGIYPLRAKLTAIALLTLFIVTREIDRKWQVEDWRGAALQTVALRDTERPLLFYNGLVEAQNIEFLTELENKEYLTAPLSYYRVLNPVTLLPAVLEGKEGYTYFNNTVKPLIYDQKSFVFMASDKLWISKSGEAKEVGEYYTKVFKGLNFKAAPLKTEGSVLVYIFTKSS